MIDALNSTLGSISLCAILLVLGFNTLRDIVKFSGLIPKRTNSKLSNFVYGKPDTATISATVDQAFDALGLSAGSREAVRTLNSYNAIIPVKMNADEHLAQLVCLLSRHTLHSDDPIIYGQGQVTSNFYISTMDAALSTPGRNALVKLMHNLLVLSYAQHPKPDFILTSKMGNSALALALAEKEDAICIFRKEKTDHSRIHTQEDGKPVPLLVNFEGANLLKELHKKIGRPLNGVAVDCNCSTGTLLVESINDFNESVANQFTTAVKPIVQAYVLFRADTNSNTDNRFRQNGLRLSRYIDLNEKSKQQLFDIGKDLLGSPAGDLDLDAVRKINDFIEQHRRDGQIHT